MKAVIKELPEITIYGKKTKDVSPETVGNLIKEWVDFFEIVKGKYNPEHMNSYGLSDNMRMEAELFDYTIGMEKESYTEIPEGFEEITLPANKYAVYTFKGKIGGENVSKFIEDIYMKWMPEEKLEYGGEYSFEYYDERWEDDSDNSEFDIYVPIK
ncbi:GyrI-like domain-containing protein [Sebaldella sp. S0638]|uniref:GyrI-like domain-containing protein n=1 Tax=Sebaldella sp. S0638 TaxID=2957809 RepID=UPI00209EF895|nr:GyrI-like domain-containing protein [Sebaldella sp. S0638]MCP1224023.1 GyrI-like domain-containing protein [Sebaldella sp. S0638]